MKKILLITTAVIMFTAFFAGCKNPAEHAAPAKITITVAGDIHVSLKPEYSFEVEKGKTWRQLKAQAEGKIGKCEENYEPDKWTLTNASGQNLTDDYIFNKNVTVFLVTKQTITPPKPKIVITVAGDEHVTLKAEHTFEVVPGTKWDEIKLLANGKIDYTGGYKNKTWKLNNASGTVILGGHQFNENTTVYAESQPITAPHPAQVTITVAGDSHIIHKETNHTFNVNKDETWAHAKALAANKIKYADGYENDTWKLTDGLGQDIPDNHQFNADTTVYAVSKKIAITITVAGDENVVFKNSDDRTFTAYYGDTWSAIKLQAEGKIDYKAGYENAGWKLNNASGDVIAADYRFTTNTTVYAVSKKKTITITIAGDSQIYIATADDRNKLKRDYGVTWAEIKDTAYNLITGYKDNHDFSAWKLNSGGIGAEIEPTHKFTADTTVYAISKRTHVILTIKGDANIIVPNPNTHRVLYDSKWEDNKVAVVALLGYKPGYKLKGWKLNNAGGHNLRDSQKFREDTVIYAVSKPDKVKITVKGDEYVQVKPAPNNEFLADDGAKWETIEAEAISKITGYTPRYRLSRWAIDNADGSGIYDDTTFEEDTIVYAITEELPEAPVSEGVKVDGATITGKNPSCPLPAGSDASWNGVFPAGRTVTLNSYFIGKNEVTVEIWDKIYYWAKENGYNFEFDGEGHEDNPPASVQHPITKVSWRDCIVWCNAYTELKYGTTEHCVYRENSSPGAAAVKSAHDQDADGAYFDQSKKGFRLPTEAEWEYAARYQDNATNAEQYGAVYLTKVNSASGATKPVGFEGMAMPSGETYETLRAETARVAVFNKYYNGSAFVAQSPAVTGLAAVKSRAANKLGLFDMSGNAAEWCWDRYSTTLSSGLVTDPIGSSSSADTERVLRGGNWSENTNDAVYGCMTGKRDSDSSHNSYDVVGFRLVWKE